MSLCAACAVTKVRGQKAQLCGLQNWWRKWGGGRVPSLMGSPSTWGLPTHPEQAHLAPCCGAAGTAPQLVTQRFQVATATDSYQPLPLARHLNRELRHTPLTDEGVLPDQPHPCRDPGGGLAVHAQTRNWGPCDGSHLLGGFSGHLQGASLKKADRMGDI